MTTLSTAAFYERGILQLGSLRRQAESLQSQIAGGQKLARSSEDPVAAARLRLLGRQERLSEVDIANSDRASADLQLVDNALDSVSQLIIRSRELALQAANGTLSDADRAAIADEIAGIGQSMLTLANSKDSEGHALFGGEATGQAYVTSATGANYAGTAAARQLDLGNGQSVIRSLTGPEVFSFAHNGSTTDAFAALATLGAALAAGGAGALAAADDALGAFNAALDKISTAQTITGSRLAFIEAVDERRIESSTLVAEEQADLGGVDLASTISRLQETLTILEASQASFVRLSGLSLFNILR